MSRKFAQLEVGFFHDQRLRSLSSDSPRHAYTICLTNHVGSYVGLHEYKLRMFANDLDVDVETAERFMHELIEVGLAQYDFDRQWIFLPGWCRGANAPQNASTIERRIAEINSMMSPPIELHLALCVEFTFAVVEILAGWGPAKPERQKVSDQLGQFVEQSIEMHGNAYAYLLAERTDALNPKAKHDLRMMLKRFDDLSGHGVPTEEKSTGELEGEGQRRGEEDKKAKTEKTLQPATEALKKSRLAGAK